jgi:hypothetical protein
MNDFDSRYCGTCIYCRVSVGKLGGRACFRFPPSAFPVPKGIMSVRAPIDTMTPACGEYQPRLAISGDDNRDRPEN